jgi:hypothetical protein
MRAIAKEYGKQIFLSFSKKRLAKIISDSYAKHQELKNLLLKMADFGIPAEMLKLYSKSDRDKQVRIIVRRFAEKNKLLPESEEVNEAVSCYTFALDYGMFAYSVYPADLPKDAKEIKDIKDISDIGDIKDTGAQPAEQPPGKPVQKIPKVIPNEIVKKKRHIELKDINKGRRAKDKSIFIDFKTWFEKKRIEESKLNERALNGVYFKGEDNNYYELAQTGHLTETGTNFNAFFINFDLKKREREIIKMGIDICSELENLETAKTKNAVPVSPANIFRDKYGNYRLNRETAVKNAKDAQNPVRGLGLFMRELLDADNLGQQTHSEMLDSVVKKACKSNNKDYGATDMKKDLEYAFEMALEEWLFAGSSAPSVLTGAKAAAGEFTNEDIKDMSVPDEYAAIGARAFIRRENLRSVIIPNSIESIYGFAFGWCDRLENVTVEGVEGAGAAKIMNLGNFAFWGCENLKRVTMRGTLLKNIGDCVFYGCRKLKVDIYGNIDGDIEELIHRVFYGTRDSEINVYTEGKRKEKRYDRIFNNRIQFY